MYSVPRLQLFPFHHVSRTSSIDRLNKLLYWSGRRASTCSCGLAAILEVRNPASQVWTHFSSPPNDTLIVTCSKRKANWDLMPWCVCILLGPIYTHHVIRLSIRMKSRGLLIHFGARFLPPGSEWVSGSLIVIRLGLSGARCKSVQMVRKLFGNYPTTHCVCTHTVNMHGHNNNNT